MNKKIDEKELEIKSKIPVILNSIKDKDKRERLEKILLKKLENGDAVGLGRWYNFYIYTEGGLDDSLDHIRYIGAGEIPEKEKRVKCDFCNHEIRNYQIISLSKKKADIWLVIGEDCWPHLIRELEDVSGKGIKHKDDNKEEKLEDFHKLSLEQLETYKKLLKTQISVLESKLEKNRLKIKSMEKKGEISKEYDNIDIIQKEKILAIYENEIRIRNYLLDYLTKNSETLAKVLQYERSALIRNNEPRGTILSTLETYAKEGRISAEEARIVKTFRMYHSKIPEFMFPVLKFIWAKYMIEPKEILLGEFEKDIRTLHHIDIICSTNIEKEEYCKKNVTLYKELLEKLSSENPERVNPEYLRAMCLELESIQNIMQKSEKDLKEINKISGHIEYKSIEDILNYKENITRLEVLDIITSLPEREKTRENINFAFLNKIKKEYDVDYLLEKWIGVYEDDKKIWSRYKKEGDIEKTRKTTLSKTEYSVLRSIDEGLRAVKGKKLEDIACGFDIEKFREILYTLIILEKREGINEIKNTDLIFTETAINYLNNTPKKREMKKLIVEFRDMIRELKETDVKKEEVRKIKEKREEIANIFQKWCNSAIAYCNHIENNLITTDFNSFLKIIELSDNEGLKKISVEIRNGLIDKNILNDLRKNYEKVKDYVTLEEEKTKKVEEIIKYIKNESDLKSKLFWKSGKVYFPEIKKDSLERMYKSALKLEEMIKKDSELEKSVLLCSSNTKQKVIKSANLDSFEVDWPIYYGKTKRFDIYEIYDEEEVKKWRRDFEANHIKISGTELGKALREIIENNTLEIYLMSKDTPDVSFYIEELKSEENILWVKKDCYSQLEKLLNDAKQSLFSEEDKEIIRKEYLIKNEKIPIKNGKMRLIDLWNSGERGREWIRVIAQKGYSQYDRENAERFLGLMMKKKEEI